MAVGSIEIDSLSSWIAGLCERTLQPQGQTVAKGSREFWHCGQWFVIHSTRKRDGLRSRLLPRRRIHGGLAGEPAKRLLSNHHYRLESKNGQICCITVKIRANDEWVDRKPANAFEISLFTRELWNSSFFCTDATKLTQLWAFICVALIGDNHVSEVGFLNGSLP